MNRLHHPHNRAERLKLKVKKSVKRGRPDPTRRLEIEEAKLKEAEYALRNEIYELQEKG